MPKQHTLFGRPVRLAPRRITRWLAMIAVFAMITVFFTLPSAIPAGPSLSQLSDHKLPKLPTMPEMPKMADLPNMPKLADMPKLPAMPKLPKIPSIGSGGTSKWSTWFNPFKQPGHAPPRSQNDTLGESSWFSDWKWLSIPFSSTITLEENRSLLPPLEKRPPIYCYYDNTVKKDKATKEAESALLLVWRRAWWAQGLKPLILSPAEAMANPMYEQLMRIPDEKISKEMRTNVMRWLAWENMRGGILSSHLLLPMGSHDDPLLRFLRRGEFPSLTRFKKLDNGLFFGPQDKIAETIKLVLENPDLKEAKDMLSGIPATVKKDPFTLDKTPTAVAYYAEGGIAKSYPEVATAIEKDRAAGLKKLSGLINAHLHVAWQNTFSDGVAVLKPKPEHTASMIEAAWQLAHQLSSCSDSILPSTCPPNIPKCKPCASDAPMRTMTPKYYRNSSTMYTIGVVPHPYTFQTLDGMKERIDIPWIRRNSKRDEWLHEITEALLEPHATSRTRILRFKEAVAGSFAQSKSLWISAEKFVRDDIDWHFGFQLPELESSPSSSASSSASPSSPPPQPDSDPQDGPIPKPKDLQRERIILDRAKTIKISKEPAEIAVRNAIEAWNLADVEAWRFARAYRARSRVERLKWEEEEHQYVGGAGSAT